MTTDNVWTKILDRWPYSHRALFAVGSVVTHNAVFYGYG